MASRNTHGIKFRYGAPTLITVPDVVSVTPGAPTTEDIDATTHDSGGIRQFVRGLTDFGEGTLVINFDPGVTIHMGLWNASRAGEDLPMEIELKKIGGQTTGTRFTWNGFFRPFTLPWPTSGVQQASITFRLNTDITVVAAVTGP